MKTIAIAACCVLFAVPAFAQRFTLDPVTNCPGLGYGVHIGLKGPFTYHIEYVAGAYSPFPANWYQLGYTWYSRVHYYIYASGTYGAFGSESVFQTAAEAQAASKGVYSIFVPADGTVEFYIEEVAPVAEVCNNNRGSIKLRFAWLVATEKTYTPLVTSTQETTWGKIKALYR